MQTENTNIKYNQKIQTAYTNIKHKQKTQTDNTNIKYKQNQAEKTSYTLYTSGNFLNWFRKSIHGFH